MHGPVSRAVFNWVLKSNWFFRRFAKTKLAHFNFQPVRSKNKTNRDYLARSHAFSRPLCQLHVVALSFDWFIVLSVSFVIG